MWKLWFNNIRKLPFVPSPNKPRKQTSKFYADLNENTLRVPTLLSSTLNKSSSDIDIARTTALASFTDKGTVLLGYGFPFVCLLS